MKNLINVILFRIFRTTLYSTTALTFCAWIIQSSKYLDTINKSHITISKFLKFASYLSIDIINIILPISLAISAGFVFHRLIISHQLTAIQSSGASPTKLLSALIPLSIITMCYLYISNAYISPKAWKEFRNLEFQIKNNITPPRSSGCIFSGNNFSVYSQKYMGNFSFGNLIIIDSRNLDKTYTYFAKSGSIIDNILFLTKGERIEIDNLNKKNSIIKFETYRYDLAEILKISKKSAQPNEKMMHELLYDTGDKGINSVQQALFHQKMTSPLLTIIFSLMAFFIIIQAPYKRKNSYSRMVFLILSIVIYQGLFFWIANASVKNFNLITLNYVTAIISIVTLYFLIFIKNKT